MQKDQVFGIIGAAIGISIVDAVSRRRAIDKFKTDESQNMDKYIRSAWRDGFNSGFNDANQRLGYPIPRTEYPTFES